ncbi:hypothetical protein CDD82_196 [Ophiocordyceps australis]|uniref:Uncharacterized protein n=1 Tax=Ophiocordyceps australis TaxID=1399860 RepID=A0A2C5YJH1_9HYPO|nr:hypothetical protein CDD82_196 [Ophiocordyceps australis]
MAVVIAPPDQATLLAPLLPALPAAAASTEPAVGVLPLLSPILRQRVQLLSESSSQPWLRLLCYDASKAAKLAEIARGPNLEPHPVSGEVEVDWGFDSETRYKRLDSETLQALVALPELGIAFSLVYCVGDRDGGGDGWRIGEVTVAEKPLPFSTFCGASSISEAEVQFKEDQAQKKPTQHPNSSNADKSIRVGNHVYDDDDDDDYDDDDDDDEQDDDYWGRYDDTPARSPAMKRSPAPHAAGSAIRPGAGSLADAENDYFARYNQMQPAMDPHDPDEESEAGQAIPPLGLGQNLPSQAQETRTAHGDQWHSQVEQDHDLVSAAAAQIMQPRPESSASSNGSLAVARLEEMAERQDHVEFGVKQHISRSIRSLYKLARASGINRDEFDGLVKRELDLLALMDDEELC